MVDKVRRVGEAVRKRLRFVQTRVTAATGETVSMPEVVKQPVELAGEDRPNITDLFHKPTDALLQIRKKAEAQQALSRAEWILLAYFVQQGAEARTDCTPNPISPKSLIAILDAFRSAYELRSGNNAVSATYYLGNLPYEWQETDGRTVNADSVCQTVVETCRFLRAQDTTWKPVLAARNLYVLLRYEELSDLDALNRALTPYWAALWSVAAAGHFHLIGKPIRDSVRTEEQFSKASIAPISEGDYTLDFAWGDGDDFDVLLSSSWPQKVMYALGSYPRIAEFRAMLATLRPGRPFAFWLGRHFYGYVVQQESGEQFYFRADRATFGFSEEQWDALHSLFARAWEIPAIRMAWDALVLQYGEF